MSTSLEQATRCCRIAISATDDPSVTWGSRFLSNDGTLRIVLLGLQYGLMNFSCAVQFVYNICNNLCGFLFQHPILRIGAWIVTFECMYTKFLAIELYTMCVRNSSFSWQLHCRHVGQGSDFLLLLVLLKFVGKCKSFQSHYL